MRNFSYSLIPIFFKLYKQCDHALKICMWLGYTHQINFLSLFVQFELLNFQKLSHLESDIPVGINTFSSLSLCSCMVHKHCHQRYVTKCLDCIFSVYLCGSQAMSPALCN